MSQFNTEINLAHNLDAQDELSSFRDEFVIDDPRLIYMDGNSLGRLPKRTIAFMQNAIEQEWGKRLIRIWNEGWINTPTELGADLDSLTITSNDLYKPEISVYLIGECIIPVIEQEIPFLLEGIKDNLLFVI